MEFFCGAIRIIPLKKYNAQTEPIFKSLNLLKVSDIFSLCQLKCYYNLVHRNVPEYFHQLHLVMPTLKFIIITLDSNNNTYTFVLLNIPLP